MITVYADGGVIQKNPSAIGGTWAFVAVDEYLDQELWRRSGFITSEQMGTPTVTNNQTELLAIIYGLQLISHFDKNVRVCSDSEITLNRVFGKSPFNNIPEWMMTLLKREKFRLENFSKFKHTLLAGHPTKSQLSKGIGKNGHPVSKWNVLCDDLCREESEKALVYIERFTKSKN